MNIFDFNTADIFNAAGGGSPLSIIDSVLHPSYVIRKHNSTAIALHFSGMRAMQPEGRANIVNAPVERGKYQSINKVYQPGKINCEVVISGLTGFTGAIPDIFDFTLVSQNETLKTIISMLKSAQLYDIETPKGIYSSYDLVDYSYHVSSTTGVSLLSVSLIFQEVMQQMEVVLSSVQDSKKATSDNKTNSLTGTCPINVFGGNKQSTVSELSKSWDSLKKSLDELLNKAGGDIFGNFQSALDTVGEAADDILKGAADKASDLVKNITGMLP